MHNPNLSFRTLEHLADLEATREVIGFQDALTYQLGTRYRISSVRIQASYWQDIANRTKSDRLKRKATKQLESCQYNISRHKSSIQYGVEHRAKRAEDREQWESQGYRVLDCIDSGTFSTQPFPYEYASRYASDYKARLAAIGVTDVRIESPDYEYHSVRCSYWGGTYSNPTGHVCILVKADTPMDLELIRRRYAASQDAYWTAMHTKYGWTSPIPVTNFRNW